MIRYLSILILFFFSFQSQSQISSHYSISFENAVHHETTIVATFSDLKSDEVVFKMSRSSPGRYALHEFAKNVYNVKVTDSKGNILKATRPDPYSWKVKGHDGSIIVSYTLFADRGDGTYAQVDETHAHLNMPATFMFVPSLAKNEMEVTFNLREDLNWKVATQLKHQEGTTYYAKDLQYFMDSPCEIANFRTRTFVVDSNGNKQTINFVLHDDAASDEDLNAYFEDVKKIVLQEKAVFGELPKYDYGEYTFLACYMPNASGDGMEHRNSTVVSSTRSLSQGGIEQNIGTVAHEFFHCWNVERIRPQALEPFDFERANMSGELWFAEGFTSYYDDLSLCRAKVITHENYIKGLIGTFNYVWTSPGRMFFNPIEMSYQAPFVDAAKSVDETNRENTFISYYSYGSTLGLALDLSLREKNLNLDDYMKRMWKNFGKVNKFYTIEDLHQTLNNYAGKEFGDHFFNEYIYKSGMPDYNRLLNRVGVQLETYERIDFGATVRNQKIMSNPKINSSAYDAGFQNGDKILQLDAIVLEGAVDLNSVLSTFKVGDTLKVTFERYGATKEVMLKLKTAKSYNLTLKNDGPELDKSILINRYDWLESK